MKKIKVNQKFGYLTVIGLSISDGRGVSWVVKCVCGKSIVMGNHVLGRGSRGSCGCKEKELKSFSKFNKKNPMWKGRKVKYEALHQWMNTNFKKPKLCQCCKKNPPYDLANIKSNKNKKTYTRDIKNWEWLCRRCHMTKDGRLDKFRKMDKQYLIQTQRLKHNWIKKNEKWFKHCKMCKRLLEVNNIYFYKKLKNFSTFCKICSSKVSKQYYVKNKNKQ